MSHTPHASQGLVIFLLGKSGSLFSTFGDGDKQQSEQLQIFLEQPLHSEPATFAY